jgi:hypothetical protein
MAKRSVKRFVATTVLLTLLGTGVELAIYESLFDHTKDNCIISHIPLIGVHHQGRAMERNMKEKGWSIVTYALESNPETPQDVDAISVYYDYKPIEGMEDSTNLLNNYQQHITVNRK